MTYRTIVATLGVVVLISWAWVNTEPTVNVRVQEQPAREPYVAPVWVTNAQGQRCIKQGETVTCG